MNRSTGRVADRIPDVRPVDAGQDAVPAEYRPETHTPAEYVSFPERRGRGPGETGLRDVLASLSGRDIAVLEITGRHRFLTTGQVEGFCFHNHASAISAARTARRVLARLERERLIERPRRRIGGFGSGSAASIWILTSTGQRLINLMAGRGAVGRARTPGERFVAHHLAVADTHLALVTASRLSKLAVLQVQLEPACWRTATGVGGARLVLKPDLYAVTATTSDSEYEDHWFLEVDRATESLPTVIRQCRAYQEYRATGAEQTTRGVFPLVIWLVPEATRLAKLRAAIAGARGLDAGLFLVSTMDGLLPLLQNGGGS